MIINDYIKEPKISIIITYYNLGEYIKDCIESILNQTYKNFEIIVVNDNSDEKNSSILNSLKNENIKIINLKENKGQLLAFLEGLSYSSGEFICMIDADDVILPNHLKTLLYTHLKNNYALISSSCGEINKYGDVTSLNYVKNRFKNNSNKINYEEIEEIFKEDSSFSIERVKGAFGLWNWSPSTSAMFRKSSLDIIKYFPNKEYWKTGADKVLFSILDLVGGSINISAVTFLYRHHDSNSTQSTTSTGNKRFLNEKYIEKLINWNKKLRIDTLRMFLNNKQEITKEYNKLNYLKMLCRVFFCIDIKVCAKILKTFAHKLIQY